MTEEERGARRRRRMLVYCVWLAVCWGHSLMPGDVSSLESSRFVFLVRPLFLLFNITNEQLMTFAIRKTAHFTEYAILALLARRASRAWFEDGMRANLLCAVLTIAAPALDEFIQTFVPGRAGQPTDVLIDLSGALCGLVVAHLIERFFPNYS